MPFKKLFSRLFSCLSCLLLFTTFTSALAQQQNPFGLTPQQMALLSAATPDLFEALFGPFQIYQFESRRSLYRSQRVDRIVARLRPHVRRNGIQVFVIQDSAINAFTIMGGRIYINTGLIEFVGDDDDALAAAIAHEMGHAARYHVGQGFATQFVANSLAMRLTRNDQTAARHILQLLTRNYFTRDMEKAADDDGVRLICAAGYDAAGALRFMQRFQAFSPGRTSWFDDHPSPGDRVSRLRPQAASCSNQATTEAGKGASQGFNNEPRSSASNYSSAVSIAADEARVFDVVHYHGYGAFSTMYAGQLRISRAGISWKETEAGGNKNDDFTASCAEIVEAKRNAYLQLGQSFHIRVGRKNYNFTQRNGDEIDEILHTIAAYCSRR